MKDVAMQNVANFADDLKQLAQKRNVFASHVPEMDRQPIYQQFRAKADLEIARQFCGEKNHLFEAIRDREKVGEITTSFQSAEAWLIRQNILGANLAVDGEALPGFFQWHSEDEVTLVPVPAPNVATPPAELPDPSIDGQKREEPEAVDSQQPKGEERPALLPRPSGIAVITGEAADLAAEVGDQVNGESPEIVMVMKEAALIIPEWGAELKSGEATGMDELAVQLLMEGWKPQGALQAALQQKFLGVKITIEQYLAWWQKAKTQKTAADKQAKTEVIQLKRKFQATEELKIKAALESIPPHNGKDWFTIGAVLHNAYGGSTEGKVTWEKWSRGECTECGGPCKKYDQAAQDRTWIKYRDNKGVTLASLYKIAQENGALIGLPPRDAIEYLNERFISVGDFLGKAVVLDVRSLSEPNLTYRPYKDFKEAHCHYRVEVGEKTAPLGEFWLHAPTKRHYDRVGFYPGRPLEFDGTFNLWRGFAHEPIAGDGPEPNFPQYTSLCAALGVEAGFGRGWDGLLRVIVEALGAGAIPRAVYLLRYAAWRMQNLDKLPGVSVVLRGEEEGAGKTTYGEWLGELVGKRHFTHLQDPTELMERFNERQAYSLVTLADEVFFAGDPRQRGKLYNRITATSSPAEGKYTSKKLLPNYAALIQTTNLEWAVPASVTARRFAVFDVAPVFVGKRDFWRDEVFGQLASGGYGASLDDLLRLPLGKWHPSQIEQTPALLRQKRLSLAPEAAWALDLAEEGSVSERRKDGFVLARVLIDKAKALEPRLARTSAKAILKVLTDIGIPSATSGGAGRRLPHLKEFRQRLDGRFAGCGEWDKADTRDWDEDAEPGFEADKLLEQAVYGANFTEKI